MLSDEYGYAYMHFGKPISLREFSEGLVDRTRRSCIPRLALIEEIDEINVWLILLKHLNWDL